MENHSEKIDKLELSTSNIDVEIKEIKPFYISHSRPLILNLKINSCCTMDISVEIISMPKHGKLSKTQPSLLIYKPNKYFCGMDNFKIRIVDSCGRSSIETVLISVDV